jgi:cytochrome bd-type quinol oxidase subunit 2
MIELFSFIKGIELYSNQNLKEGFLNIDYENTDLNSLIFNYYTIVILIISFGSAYLAYACNEYEKPATRALSTLIGFFFSGFYLIYYFFYHVLFDRKCKSRGINNIIRNITKKK